MARMRSSNCPRYLVPATTAVISSAMTRLSNKIRDTFFSTMRSARPSTIADFPTPGSPIRIGLFFLRRLKSVRDVQFLFHGRQPGRAFHLRQPLSCLYRMNRGTGVSLLGLLLLGTRGLACSSGRMKLSSLPVGCRRMPILFLFFIVSEIQSALRLPPWRQVGPLLSRKLRHSFPISVMRYFDCLS